jgi:hypothetical protein
VGSGNWAPVATVEAGQEEFHEGQAESAQKVHKEKTSSV